MTRKTVTVNNGTGTAGAGGSGGDDPIQAILSSVNRIVDQAHEVALRQCAKAREAIDAAYKEAHETISIVEQTIDAKREGTSQQIAHYLEAVRASTIAADDVNASTVQGIASIRETIQRVGQNVDRLPVPVPPLPRADKVLAEMNAALAEEP